MSKLTIKQGFISRALYVHFLNSETFDIKTVCAENGTTLFHTHAHTPSGRDQAGARARKKKKKKKRIERENPCCLFFVMGADATTLHIAVHALASSLQAQVAAVFFVSAACTVALALLLALQRLRPPWWCACPVCRRT